MLSNYDKVKLEAQVPKPLIPTWRFMGTYRGSFKGPFKGIYRDSVRV